MGVTVTCGKNAAVMTKKKKNGEQVFALFEKTYESNVYPHTPRWSCIAFGDYATVLKRVFEYAASCAGGMLQGTGGRWILPENYIAAWQREMSAPGLLSDFSISINLIDTKSEINEVCQALTCFGLSDLATQLMLGEKVQLQLYNDIDAVLAIYGTGSIISTWRAIDHDYRYFTPHRELAQKPCFGKINPPSAQVMAFDRDKSNDLLVKVGNGSWLNMGWEYRAIANYVMNVAYPCELISKGSAKALISDFRAQCKSAVDVPGDAKIRFVRCEVDEGKGIYKWDVENHDKMAYLLGCGQEAAAPATFIRKISDIRGNDDALHLFSNLKPQQYELQITSEKSSFTTQMDLIAA